MGTIHLRSAGGSGYEDYTCSEWHLTQLSELKCNMKTFFEREHISVYWLIYGGTP